MPFFFCTGKRNSGDSQQPMQTIHDDHTCHKEPFSVQPRQSAAAPLSATERT